MRVQTGLFFLFFSFFLPFSLLFFFAGGEEDVRPHFEASVAYRNVAGYRNNNQYFSQCPMLREYGRAAGSSALVLNRPKFCRL